MPRLRIVAAGQSPPFDFHELLAALAPRPLFTNSPQRDTDFSVAGVRKVVTAASEIYQLHDAGDRLTAVYPDTTHDFPQPQREAAYQWLQQALK
jgi:hypothetical protein